MSPRALGIGVATLTALLWAAGALMPAHHGYWTSLDLRWYFYPLYHAFYGALAGGAPTIWNPYQLCGVPVVGTLQGGFFYPFHVLYLLLPTEWALATSTALHAALAAGTSATFARRAGLSAPAAMLAAAVFAMTGMLRQWQLWPYLVEACAWIPLGCIGILDLTRDRRGRGALLLAVAGGVSWLAGSPQGTIFAIYVWGGLLLARVASRAVAPRERLPALAAGLAAMAAGGLLAAVALLPAWEVARESVRQARDLDPAFLYPMGGIPRLGGVAGLWLATGSALLAPALALVPLAVLADRGWLTAWGVAVGGSALLLALGPVTPAVHLYFILPALGWFRVPYRLLLVAGFCAGVLAGLGLDAVTRRLRAQAATGFVVVGVLLAALTSEGLRMPRPEPPLPYRRSAVPWTPVQHEAYRRLAETARGDRVWPFSPGIFANSLPPKLPSVVGLRSIEDYEPLALRRQADFFVYFTEGSVVSRQLSAPFEGRITTLTAPLGREPTATRRRLLDLAATRFVLLPAPMRARPDVVAFVRDAGLTSRPDPAPGLALLENPHALPRAFVTYRARRAPATRELLAAIAREGFDPLVESFVEGDVDTPAPDAPARGAAAAIVRDEAQVVEVRATLASPGLVVLADTYAPGWRASVDGAAAPLLATNHLFRGVPAPAGEHLVRFEYRPRSLQLGAAISLATALGLGTLAWRARNSPRAPTG